MTEAKALVFRFADSEVREREFVLIKAGRTVPLEPKAFHVLLFLLRNSRRLVTKQEIVDAVWKDCSVSDNSLTKSVATLRRVLEDDSREPRYIATVQTVGYRFVCDVTVIEEGARPLALALGPQTEIPAQPEARRRYWKSAAVSSALVLATFLVWLSIGNRTLSWRTWGLSSHRAEFSNRQGGLSAIKRRPLTANPEDSPITSVAISPDGKYLAYSDSTGLYLKLVDSGETHPVALPVAFTPTVESWFPDSVHLIVSWVEDSKKPPGLWDISALGGSPRKLTDVGSCARVSPDGSQIAFLRGPWDDNEIWLMDSNGNDVRKLVDAGLDYYGAVAWSPDGQRFATVRASVERPEGQIQVYDPRTGQAESILSMAGLGPDLLWTAPGKLFFSQMEAPPNQDNSNLWSLQLEARTGRLSGSPSRLTDNPDRIGSITASTDGRRLAVLRYRQQSDVFLTTIEEKGRKLSTPRRLTLDQRQDFPSSWTPDSKAVLIVSNRDGVSHIFKQRADQIQPELFVGGKQDVWLPHIAPDGSNMLYLASAEQVGPSDKVQLKSIPLVGGPSRTVLEEPGIVNYQCARSPSRACVYGKVESQSYKFYGFNYSTGDHLELPIRMKKGSFMNNWNLSPDGRYLAISETQNPYEGPRIRIVSLADNTERLLTVRTEVDHGCRLGRGLEESLARWVLGKRFLGQQIWSYQLGSERSR